MPNDSQFGSNTPWAKAVASKAAEDAKPKSGTSGNNSQFGSDTPWAKAVAALNPPAQGHYGPPAPPKQAQGHYGPPAPPKQAQSDTLQSTTVSATPYIPQSNNVSSYVAPPPIKTAAPDIILFDEEAVPIEVMSDLIFENIGGQELISIVRSDTVNGQKIIYQPIKNLPSIQQQYNPNNILGLQQTSDKYFAGFSIKLEDKIPNQGNGTNGQNVYIEENGDLIIEFVNINDDEQVEVQITLNGTIYEANLGE